MTIQKLSAVFIFLISKLCLHGLLAFSQIKMANFAEIGANFNICKKGSIRSAQFSKIGLKLSTSGTKKTLPIKNYSNVN